MTDNGFGPQRITIVKPDHGVIGGFERVIHRVARHLRARGHQVRVTVVRTDVSDDSPMARVPSKALARAAPEFLAHLAQLSSFRRLDLRDADLVISTQPPSQGIRHDRHLALFYHHDRIFYDLANLMVSSNYVVDPDLHLELASIVRQADRPGMDGVTTFAVPSHTVQQRLQYFNQVQEVMPFYAGTPLEPPPSASELDGPRDHVLCVSRHEFPKRTELFVQAAHLMPELPTVCVGTGSRLDFVRRIDRHLDLSTSVDPTKLWCRPPSGALPFSSARGTGVVRFVTDASGPELEALYRRAKVVVAPALGEDYGLTAIEAMMWGAPLVVCDDGGSLAEIVKETGAGEVVPPTAPAIADAVRRLAYEERRAAPLVAAGRRAVEHRFSWPQAFDQMDEAISRVLQA